MAIRITRRATLQSLAVLPLAAATFRSALFAQDRGTLRILVGFPAASTSDLVARYLAPHLGSALGRTAVVEAKAGADGQIAAQEIRRLPPDGSALFVATNSPMAAVPAMRQPPPYDPIADFTHIGYVGRYLHFLLVSQDTPFQNVAELLAYAKANPGKLNVGNGASFQKIATAQLLKEAQVRMNEVNYKGEPAALQDLVPGRVQVMIGSQGVALEFIKDKRVRPLAVTASHRLAVAPDVPTLREAGLNPFAVVPWVGLFGPPGMDPALVDRINKALRAALDTAEVKGQMDRIGIEAQASSPAELRQMVREQLQLWQRNVKELGLAG